MKVKETLAKFTTANRSVLGKADLVLIIKWRSMNTERGDEILNKTKQSQMKEILNEQQADIKKCRMKRGTIVRKLKIKYLNIYQLQE